MGHPASPLRRLAIAVNQERNPPALRLYLRLQVLGALKGNGGSVLRHARRRSYSRYKQTTMQGLSVGSTIAGCRIDALAGRGGMGVVYRATQTALERSVAVKAIAPHFAQDPDYRERFQRESHIAASLDHPNVIPVYEAGELDGTLFLVMRWVDGTDLRELIASEGRLAPARAVTLLRPVASALSAAHRRGLIHRDIKPANVLIAQGEHQEDEHVYLTDFGVAKRAEGEAAVTRTGVLVGTLDYTAPERIEGGKGTPASDIYSFGCMLFEALTGHVPFDRPSDLTRMYAHLNDPVPSARDEAPGVSEELDALIAKAMAKRPEDRFATASELARALDRALEQAQTGEVKFRARLERAQLPTDEAAVAPGDDTAVAPGDDTAVAPGDKTAVAPGDKTAVAPGDKTAVAPGDKTAVAPGDKTAVAPGDKTAVAPGDDTAVAPGDDTAVAPGDETVVASGTETAAGADETLVADAPETATAGVPQRTAAVTPQTAGADAPETIAAGAQERAVAERIPKTAADHDAQTAVGPPGPPPPRSRTRSRAVFAVPLALIVLVGAIVALSQSGGGSSTTSTGSSSAASGEVRSTSGTGLSASATVDLGGTATALTTNASGELFASLAGNGVLVRVAAGSGTLTQMPVGGTPTAIGAGTGGVWVSGSKYGPLALVNAQTGDKVEAVSLPGGSPIAISVEPDDGSVWTADASGNVTHVSQSGQLMGPSIPVSPPPVDISWGEGWLWAVTGDTPGLVRVGPPAQTFDSGQRPVSVTFNNGVWTAHASGHVTRFDPRLDKLDVNARVPVASPDSVDSIASVEDKSSPIWAISKAAKTLYRIRYAPHVVTGKVVFASSPVALAVSGGSAWVATADGKLIEITSARP